MKSMNISSGSRRWNFLKQVIAMLIGDEIVPPVRKWYKVAKRIIEIIAPSDLHWDKKRDRSVSAAVFLYALATKNPQLCWGRQKL